MTSSSAAIQCRQSILLIVEYNYANDIWYKFSEVGEKTIVNLNRNLRFAREHFVDVFVYHL